MDESIFICDPAPGPLRCIECSGMAWPKMTVDLNERLEKAAREGRSVVVLPFGLYSFTLIRETAEWSDAEFCTA